MELADDNTRAVQKGMGQCPPGMVSPQSTFRFTASDLRDESGAQPWDFPMIV
jgi:hypothetical protein